MTVCLLTPPSLLINLSNHQSQSKQTVSSGTSGTHHDDKRNQILGKVYFFVTKNKDCRLKILEILFDTQPPRQNKFFRSTESNRVQKVSHQRVPVTLDGFRRRHHV